MSLRPKTRRRMTIVAVVGLAIVMLFSAFIIWRRSQVQDNAAELKATAMAAYQDEQWPQALQSFSQYITRNQDDAEARYYFADVRRRLPMKNAHHIRESIGHLQAAMALQPGYVEAQELLLELLPTLAMHTETLELTDQVLARDPNHAKALRARAGAMAGLRRFDEARQSLEKLMSVDPEAVDARMLELQVMRAAGQDGERLVDHARKLRDAHPSDPAYELVLAHAYMLTGQRDNARQWVQTAAARQPEATTVVRMLVTLSDSVGMFDTSLEAMRRLADEDPDMRAAVAQRLWEKQKPGEAIEYLPDAPLATQRTDLLALRALCLIDAGKQDQIEPTLAVLRERAAEQAEKPLPDTAIDEAPDIWVDVINNWTQGLDGPAPRMISIGLKGIERQPANPYFRHVLARGYASVGEADLAINTWAQAIPMRRSWAVPYVELSRQLLRKGALREAMQIAEGALTVAPDWPDAQLTHLAARSSAMGANADDSPERLLADVQAYQKEHPNDMLAAAIEVQTLLRLNRKQDATDAIRMALARSEDENAILQLATLSQAADLGVHEACLERVERVHGQTPSLALHRTLVRWRDEKLSVDQAIESFDETRKQSDDPTGFEWMLARARLLERTNDDRAAAAFGDLLAQHANDVRAANAVIQSNAAWSDRDLVDRAIKQLRKATGDRGVAWRIARARWTLGGDPDEPALASTHVMLADLTSELPNAPQPLVLLARCLQMMDEPLAAREQLERAANVLPNNPALLLDLARLEHSTGDRNAAIATLERITRLAPMLNSQQRNAAASMLSQLGESDRLIQLLQSIEADQLTTGEEALLAQTYLQRNALEQAEPVIQGLYARSVDPLTVQLSAELLARQGKMDEALARLDELDQLDAAPGLNHLLRAEFAQKFGSAEQGYEHLQAAAKQNPQSPLVWRQLISFELRAGAIDEALAHAIEARDALESSSAGMVALVDNAARIRPLMADPALRSVAASMIESPDNVEPAMSLLNMLHEANAQERTVDRVMADLEDYVSRHSNYLPGQLAATEYMSRFGRIEEATALALRTMETFPDAPQPAQAGARLLAAAGRIDEAIGVAQQWRERTPSQTLPADLFIAELELQLNQPQRALNRLNAYASLLESEPEALASAVTIRATAMTRLGEYDAVEALFEPLFERHPRWTTIWINLATNQAADRSVAKRWLDIVRPKIDKDNVQARVMLAEAYYTIGKQTDQPDLVAQSERLLDAIAADFPDSGNVALTQAIRHEREGNSQKTEAAYRRTLELIPNQPIAANNLAMVLVNRNGDLDEAAQLIAKAIEARPDIAAFQDTAAQIEARRENYTKAIEHLLEATRLEPRTLEWRLNLAEMMAKAGRTDEARAIVERLESINVDDDRMPDRMRDKLRRLREQLVIDAPEPAATP